MPDYFGRKKLTAQRDAELIAMLANNEADIKQNLEESSTLYGYIKGNQDVLTRTRAYGIGETINVVENRAKQIIDFKTSYEFAYPVYYINKTSDEEKKIDVLNMLSDMDSQAAKHIDLMEWAYATGAGYMSVQVNSFYEPDADEIPYFTSVISSDKAFVIYSDDGKDTILAGGMYDVYQDGDKEYARLQVYHDKAYHKWIKEGNEIDFSDLSEWDGEYESEGSPFGVPIIEYPLNASRMGFVELVKSLLDAVNDIQSNRAENISDIVQSFLWLHNVDIGETPEERASKKRELIHSGMLVTKSDKDQTEPTIKYVSQILNQTDAQTTKDDMLDAIFDICGLPNRNMQLSQIEKTGAMLMGGGYQRAESMAQKTAIYFSKSEAISVKKRLEILREIAQSEYDIGDLRLSDISITTTRNPNMGAYEKAQTAGLLISGQITSPEDALEIAGFQDSSRLNHNRKLYWEANQNPINDNLSDDSLNIQDNQDTQSEPTEEINNIEIQGENSNE